MNNNICKVCGGMTQPFVIDTTGNLYRKCHRYLTTKDFSKEILGRTVGGGGFISCDTVYDKDGQIFKGTISFMAGDKCQMIKV